MTDTKRIRELLDRYKRMANPALRSACAVEIVDELPALLDENDLLKQCVKDTCEDMECLPSCDSYAHDECCPVANPIHAWRQLKAEVERLRKYEQVALDMAEKGMGIVRIAPEDILREPNNGWIPVVERLPDDEHVLALSQYGAIPHRIIPGGLLGATSEVTHWMPLPAAPGGDLPPCPTCGSEGRGGGLPYCNDCDPDAAPEGD